MRQGTGVNVGLAGSQNGINYQLYRGWVASGSPVPGTGSLLDFGLKTAAGSYTVIGTSTVTGCKDTMTGSVAVVIQPYAVATVTLTATPGLVIGVGDMDTVVATVTGGGGPVTYQWTINGNTIVGATNSTFIFTVYFDNDSISCNVTSGGLCGGIVTTKLIVIHLKDVGVKQIIPSKSDVRLMPNPNRGAFNLRGTLGTIGDEDVYVEVTNMLGEVMYRNKITTANGAIDERIQLNNNIANGMYLLNLRSGTSNTVFHFVVEQ